MKAHLKQPWRSSLVFRVALFASLGIVALLLVVGFFHHRATTRELLSGYQERQRQQVDLIEIAVQSFVRAFINDIRYLSQTPSLAHLIEEFDAPTREIREQDVIRNFQALLEGKPAYYQVRFLTLHNGGPEIIRLDHLIDRIAVTPRDQLQYKGDRDYFQATLGLAPGQYYLSEINLNREFGEISEPYTPTLRASSLIYDASAAPFGMLVINVDARHLFEEVRRLVDSRVELYLGNAEGHYLMHPDSRRTFGFDLGERHNLFDDFPGAERILSDSPRSLSSTAGPHFRRFSIVPGEEQSLIAVAAYPTGNILAGLERNRNRSFFVTLALALFAAGLIALVSKVVIRRLEQVTAAIAAYQPGEQLAALPVASDDEVGVLARKFRDMSQNISEQVQRLEDARREAEEATEAKEAFLANMSHEIRTPLNAILGMAHALEQDSPSPAQASRLATLRSSAQHLLALVNDVLDFSRIRAGQARLDPTIFSPARIFSDVCQSYAGEAEAKGLELRCQLEPEIPAFVLGDATRFSQILNNLISNGVKYTEAGFVEAALGASAAADAQRLCLIIRVRDSGPGIDPVEQEQIFRRFHRAGAGGPRHPAGTGLGLTITRELVELFGGSIRIESAVDAGALFTVSLPVQSAPDAKLHAKKEPPIPTLAGRRFLYIEDLPSNVQVLEFLVGQTGAELLHAGNGAEGLEILERQPCDGVFLDLQLPGANGWEVAGEIRRRFPRLPIVAVTAQTSSAALERSQTAGMDAHVSKPVEPDVFYPLLERLFPIEPIQPLTLDPEKLETVFDHDPGKLQRIYQTLAGEFRGHRSEIAAALQSGDAERCRRAAHKMRNAALQLGFEPLLDLLEGIDPGCSRPSAAEADRRRRALAWIDGAVVQLDARRTSLAAGPPLTG
ncbi:MAG TPA: ATP-binding protein [Verrucomicrobiales bacterium]|nr:ATP-binding protein [Verrucomicrobiales bacterium]